MLVSLGSRDGPQDVVDLLHECHERIRRFGALAVRLVNEEPLPPGEVREAAARVRRYFAEALPLHVRDEEESVAPRLREVSLELAQALSSMSSEHRAHEVPLRVLLEACTRLEAGAPLPPETRETVRALVGDLEAHLLHEEQVVFPALRSSLEREVLVEMMNELRARRG